MDISVNPPLQSVKVGDTLTVYISMGPVTDLKGINIKLTYDPALLRCYSIQQGDAIGSFQELISEFDNSKGCLEYLAALLARGAGINSPGGNVCRIDFTALAAGSCELILQDIGTPLGNSSGEVIPYNLINGLVSITTGVEEIPTTCLPKIYKLEQNYPNPFNLKTLIRYQLPRAGEISLVIYNIMGEKVRTLVQGRGGPGYYEVDWDGCDDLGRRVSSGIYLCKLQTKDFTFTQFRKVIILK